jgi:uncharacterized membrane protein
VSWGIAFRLRQALKASLWFVPFVGAVLGPLIGQLFLWLDDAVAEPSVFRFSPSTATSVLTVLVGAMVSLIGFVFTISVLVVQTATGTLSPRYMRLWYRDKLQKVVLATFVGTLTFSFWLLRHVTQNKVPDIGVTAAGLAVTVSLLLLLLYLDRFVHGLRPVAVGALVARAGRGVINTGWVALSHPEGMDGELRVAPSGRPATVVRVGHPGSIQAINAQGLVALARRNDCLVVLPRSVGDFVTTGAAVAEVFCPGRPPPPRRLRRMFVLGRERTLEQDPAFAMRILVDIAIRALSPAVNDPTTAVQLLDYVEELLRAIGELPSPGRGVLRDRDGRPRVLLPVRSWEDYLHLGVTEIREYGAYAVQIPRRLRAMLEELRGAVLPEHRPAVDAELRKLDAGVVERFPAVDRKLAGVSDRQGIGGPVVRRRGPPDG